MGAMKRGGLLLLAVLVGCGTDSASAGSADLDAAPVPPLADGEAPDAAEPTLDAPAPVSIDEDTETVVAIVSSGFVRFSVEELPPGAQFNPATGAVRFHPDFTQSGVYEPRVTGHARGLTRSVTATITVRDSIAPPPPTIVSTTAGDGFERLIVRQKTDAFLDSPGRAGRTIDAVVVVPTAATASARAPVSVAMHGFGGSPNTGASSKSAFMILPSDPDNTYWWGYAESLPGASATKGHVYDYTARRVLHLVDWLRRAYPTADPDRVFVTGGSMGGAGAIAIGLLYARHFAGIEATVAQVIARNHRPSRVKQLSGLWGTPAANLDDTWDRLDLTRAMRDLPEARDQFLFTKHGKDDPTIHFGAAVTRSKLTSLSFYETIEAERIGHYTIWDEGGHGPADRRRAISTRARCRSASTSRRDARTPSGSCRARPCTIASARRPAP